MMNATQTESTKELDNIFDLSFYPDMATKSVRRTITYKGFCNKCGSDDCCIYPSIEEEYDML